MDEDISAAAAPPGQAGSADVAIAAIYRRDARRVFATLIRLLGDFDLAEEALHDAFQVPEKEELPQRLSGVLRAIYLVFNEGYFASSGAEVTRHDLSDEAIRLARLLHELLPEPEVKGLLALMLLHESRRSARTSRDGDLIPLDEQDRSLWNAAYISEGCELAENALRTNRIGSYALQAAISAVHAEARHSDETDWPQITGLYDALLLREPSAVVELNRAVAIAMRDGPQAGLALVDGLLAGGQLDSYHLAHAARADLCRKLGRTTEARDAYELAVALAQQAPEKRFLARRIAQLDAEELPQVK